MRGRISFRSRSSAQGKRNFSTSGQIVLSSDMKLLGTVIVYGGPPFFGGATKSFLRTFGAALESSSSSWTTTVASFLLRYIGVVTIDNSRFLFLLRNISASDWLSIEPLGRDWEESVADMSLEQANNFDDDEAKRRHKIYLREAIEEQLS